MCSKKIAFTYYSAIKESHTKTQETPLRVNVFAIIITLKIDQNLFRSTFINILTS